LVCGFGKLVHQQHIEAVDARPSADRLLGDRNYAGLPKPLERVLNSALR
jgi:hypothetical protein